ncbi:hypothetical protein FJ250_03495 [bacterium]|nr:hypothetical protein [bacterium]
MFMVGCSGDDCPTVPTVVQPVIDAALITTNMDLFAGGVNDKAQVFTVVQTGTLKRVEVFMNLAGCDLQFDIRATAGGVPTDSNDAVLFQKTIPAASVPSGFLAIDLGAGLPVTAGDRLALVMRGDRVTTFQWNGRSDNIYTGGDMYLRTEATSFLVWQPISFAGDACFSTWVVPAAD